MLREIGRRLAEAASLISCALNILIGTGDREITLSAGSWELRRRGAGRGAPLVWAINGLNQPFSGKDHCRRAWNDHHYCWLKIKEDARK